MKNLELSMVLRINFLKSVCIIQIFSDIFFKQSSFHSTIDRFIVISPMCLQLIVFIFQPSFQKTHLSPLFPSTDWNMNIVRDDFIFPLSFSDFRSNQFRRDHSLTDWRNLFNSAMDLNITCFRTLSVWIHLEITNISTCASFFDSYVTLLVTFTPT